MKFDRKKHHLCHDWVDEIPGSAQSFGKVPNRVKHRSPLGVFLLATGSFLRHSRTCSQFGPNQASRREPSSVARARQLRHPVVEIRFAVPDQVVDLDVLRAFTTQPPAAQASQTHLEVSRNFVFRKKRFHMHLVLMNRPASPNPRKPGYAGVERNGILNLGQIGERMLAALQSILLPDGQRCFKRGPFRGHPDMAVVAQHASRYMARYLHDRFVARSAFCKFCD